MRCAAVSCFYRAPYEAPGGPVQPAGSFHWSELWEGPERVVYGHEAFSLSMPRRLTLTPPLTPVTEGRRYTESWGIDTGCVHGGRLSALVFTEGEELPALYQVKAMQVYLEPPVPIPA